MTEIVLVSLAVKGIFISGGINIRILPEIIPRCRNNTAKFCHRRFYRNRHYRRDETSLVASTKEYTGKVGISDEYLRELRLEKAKVP